MNERARSMLKGFREETSVELHGGRREALWRSVVATSARPRRAPIVVVAFFTGALAGAVTVLALQRNRVRDVETGLDDSRALVDRTRRGAVLSAEVGEPVSRASDLADQLALYKQAQAARERGERDEAAALLREYQRRFPNGVFGPEAAMALRQLAR